MQAVKQLLQSHKLRVTQSRVEVLGLFMARNAAMSQPEIEMEMSGKCDRVTIYRTLSAFLENGIVHKVLDDAGAAKYALCAGGCHAKATHHHNHVHFKCSDCGQTVCLNDVQMPQISLPNGFQVVEQNILLQGTCPNCQ